MDLLRSDRQIQALPYTAPVAARLLAVRNRASADPKAGATRRPLFVRCESEP